MKVILSLPLITMTVMKRTVSLSLALSIKMANWIRQQRVTLSIERPSSGCHTMADECISLSLALICGRMKSLTEDDGSDKQAHGNTGERCEPLKVKLKKRWRYHDDYYEWRPSLKANKKES